MVETTGGGGDLQPAEDIPKEMDSSAPADDEKATEKKKVKMPETPAEQRKCP